jgi:hypothetical protein
MNRTEAQLLREATKSAIRKREWLWWELKRQAFDFGYQSSYPLESDYQPIAEKAISLLPTEVMEKLREIYTSQHKNEPAISDESLIQHYAALMVEEIIRRACVAANRTIHW